MNTLKRNESGFSAVELILVLVVVAILTGAGWLFYKHSKKTPATTTTTTTTKTDATSKDTDPTTSWTNFSDTTGKFNLRYPTAWQKKVCDPGTVFLASTAETLGICSSEFGGQVIVLSVDGDQRSNYTLNPTYYTGLVKTAVTVDGVTGTKETGTSKAPADPDGMNIGGMPDGTVTVYYVFYTNSKTYVAQYTQRPTYPDILSDFNLLVTKTLDFTP